MASLIKNSFLCVASLSGVYIILSDLKSKESRLPMRKGLILLGLGVIFFTAFEKVLEKFLSETKIGSYYFRKNQLRYVDAIEVANK